MLEEPNRGICQAPRCVIVSGRCSSGYCGICCRRSHGDMGGHVLAPLVQGVLTITTNKEGKLTVEKVGINEFKPEKEVPEELPVPQPNALVRVTEEE